MAEGYIKGKPNVSWWLGQIRMGIEYRKKFAREQEWETWRRYYRGHWDHGMLASALYFKMLRTIVPRVYFRNPSISVASAKPGATNLAFAHILERVDNKLIRGMKVKKQIKRIVQNAFMYGTGIGKLGYGAEFSLVPDVDSTDDPNVRGEAFEYNANVRADMPWFMSVHPGNFIVPSGLREYDATRWSAMWVKRPLADVQGDPRFKNTANLSATASSFVVNMDNAKHSIKKPVDMVDLVEIRDKKTGKVMVLAPYATDKVLFFGTDELYINGRHTFYDVVFNLDDDVFWGVPDSVHIDPLQRELNEIKTQKMKHRRMSLVKILAEVGAVKETEVDKMVSENVNPVVWVNDLNKAIKIMDASHVPDSLYKEEEDVMRDARETVAFSRNQFGEFNPGSSDTTALEASIVNQAADIRVDERRDMVADMLVDMVTDMHQIIFDHWDTDQVIDIAGPNGVQLWVEFTGEVLKGGGYEVNIDPDSSVPETKQVREQKALAMYQLLSQNPVIASDPAKFNALTKYLITEMNNVGLEDLLQGVPEGQGLSEDRPLQPEQLGQVLQNAAGAVGRPG